MAITDGPNTISDAEVTQALEKIGAETDPAAIEAYRKVGQWACEKGVIEVALAKTFLNEDLLGQAMQSAQQIMQHPDDMVKVKGVSSVALLVNTRIRNLELTLKCAEAAGLTQAQQNQRPVNQAPIFGGPVSITVEKPEKTKEAIPA